MRTIYQNRLNGEFRLNKEFGSKFLEGHLKTDGQYKNLNVVTITTKMKALNRIDNCIIIYLY